MPREMARKPRLIYPSISTSADLAECSMAAQLLFERLFANADDQGRITGNPMKLKLISVPGVKEIIPEDIPGLLNELAVNNLIILYEASSEPVIQLKGWWSHQGHQRWRYPSNYPAPEGWKDRIKMRRKTEPEDSDCDCDPPLSDKGGLCPPTAAHKQPESVPCRPGPRSQYPDPVSRSRILPPVGGTKAPPSSSSTQDIKFFFSQALEQCVKRKQEISILGNVARWYLYWPHGRSQPPAREFYSQIGGMMREFSLDALEMLECLLDTLGRDRQEHLEGDPLVFVRAIASERGHRARDSPG